MVHDQKQIMCICDVCNNIPPYYYRCGRYEYFFKFANEYSDDIALKYKNMTPELLKKIKDVALALQKDRVCMKGKIIHIQRIVSHENRQFMVRVEFK